MDACTATDIRPCPPLFLKTAVTLAFDSLESENEEVRYSAVHVLKNFSYFKGAVQIKDLSVFKKLLDDSSDMVKQETIYAIGFFIKKGIIKNELIPEISDLLDAKDIINIRSAAAHVIWWANSKKIDIGQSIQALIRCMEEDCQQLRKHASGALVSYFKKNGLTKDIQKSIENISLPSKEKDKCLKAIDLLSE